MALDGSDPAAVLVGMPDFVVLTAVEDDGELWLLVETTAAVGRLGARPPRTASRYV